MIRYLIAFMLFASPCLAGIGIGGFPQPGPGYKQTEPGGETTYYIGYPNDVETTTLSSATGAETISKTGDSAVTRKLTIPSGATIKKVHFRVVSYGAVAALSVGVWRVSDGVLIASASVAPGTGWLASAPLEGVTYFSSATEVYVGPTMDNASVLLLARDGTGSDYFVQEGVYLPDPISVSSGSKNLLTVLEYTR